MKEERKEQQHEHRADSRQERGSAARTDQREHRYETRSDQKGDAQKSAAGVLCGFRGVGRGRAGGAGGACGRGAATGRAHSGRRVRTRSNAATTSGSNWMPVKRRSSLSA
jgi:hypothetical protein